MYQQNPYSAPPPRKALTERAIRRKLFLIRAFFAIVAAVAVVWFLISCRVETVSVQGLAHLSEAEVLDAVNIKSGKHLFAVNENKAKKSVLALSPYASDVTVTRILPKTIVITVSERKALYYVLCEGEYYLLSEDLTVLEKSYDKFFAASEAQCELLVGTVPKTEIGEMLTFENKEEQKRLRALLVIFAKSPLVESMTSLDLREPYGISAVVADQYTLKFGSEDALAQKLALCEKSVNYLTSHMGRVAGILYATSPEKVSFVMTGVAD